MKTLRKITSLIAAAVLGLTLATAPAVAFTHQDNAPAAALSFAAQTPDLIAHVAQPLLNAPLAFASQVPVFLAQVTAPDVPSTDTPAVTATAPEPSSDASWPALLLKIVTWYGIACVGFNGLAALVSTIVKQTPGTSDDQAVDKLYASKPYKAIAWIFSWGDYLAEAVAKLKT